MRIAFHLSLFVATATVSAYGSTRGASLPSHDYHQLRLSSGFANPLLARSADGHAACITGLVTVPVTANNTKLLYSGPVDQEAATQTLIDLLQINPTIYRTTYGGSSVVNGTYAINSKLCVPVESSLSQNLGTIQFLTHGATLGIQYWDIAPGYSYVDAAAKAGYATFSYDRLGVGKSDHPDPIQVVQASMHVEIAHQLVQFLRTAHIGGFAFKTVVGVGHSAGSTISQAVTAKYPRDFDSVILTGTSISVTYVGTGLASFSLQIANTDTSRRFAGIANGYLTQSTPESIQFPFLSYPYYDNNSKFSGKLSYRAILTLIVLSLQVATKETNTFGELLTLAGIVNPSPNFTGPVNVVLGEKDLIFCGGNCTFPVDQSALVVPTFYPAASNGSQHYLVPNTGHVINAHQAAPQAFAQMISFLKSNRIV